MGVIKNEHDCSDLGTIKLNELMDCAAFLHADSHNLWLQFVVTPQLCLLNTEGPMQTYLFFL